MYTYSHSSYPSIARARDSILLNMVYHPYGASTVFTYGTTNVYVAGNSTRTACRITQRYYNGSGYSYFNTVNYSYTGNNTGYVSGANMSDFINLNSFSYSVDVTGYGGAEPGHYVFTVSNVLRSYPTYTFEDGRTYTNAVTKYESPGVPYSTKTTSYGERMGSPVSESTVFHGFDPDITVSSANEYDSKYRLVMAQSARADGNTSDLYKTFYTYDDTYSIPTEINYKTDANTSVRKVNTLSADKKSVLSEQTFVNNVLKEKCEYTYTSNGNISQKKVWYDIAGNGYITTNYTYVQNTSLVNCLSMTVTDIDGTATTRTAEYGYDSLGNVTAFVNAKGMQTLKYYDDLSRLASLYLANADIMINYAYNDTLGKISYTTLDGATVAMTFNDMGDLVYETTSHGGKTAINPVPLEYYPSGEPFLTVAYDVNGESYALYEGIDDLGRKTGVDYTVFGTGGGTSYKSENYAYSYSSQSIGGVTLPCFEATQSFCGTDRTDVLKSAKTYIDKFGDVLLESSVLGNNTHYGGIYYEWDSFGRVTEKYYIDEVTNLPVTISEYAYDYAGRVISETNADGNTRSTVYDALGRKTAESDFKGKWAYYTYDEASRVIMQRTPFGESSESVKKMYYDGVGNLIKETQTDGISGDSPVLRSSEYTYDVESNLTDAKTLLDDGIYMRTHYEYNDAGRLVGLYTGLPFDYSNGVSPGNYSLTSYTYDAFGNNTSVTDALGNTKYFDYDCYGKLRRKGDTTFVDGEWNWYEYDYDRYGNLKTESSRIAAGSRDDGVLYEYDDLNNITATKRWHWNYWEVEPDANGYYDESPIVDSTESTFTYDGLGRLSGESVSLGGKAAVKSYAYNGFGAETSFTLTLDGVQKLQKTSTYDDFLRLESVTQAGKTTSYAYDANGNLATETTGNIVTNYTYNSANMVTAMDTVSGETDVTGFAYTYAPDGNQTSKTDTVQNTRTSYTYDLAGQLLCESRANTGTNEVFYTSNYYYDLSGNRLLKLTYEDEEMFSVSSTYNGNNQLTSSTDSRTNTAALSTYDSHGNLINEGGKIRGYDSHDRQTSYNDGTTTTTYTYYIDGLRKSKKVGNGAEKYFVWSGGNMVYEFTSTEDTAYTYGLRLISSDDYNYVLNAHGDVVALLNASGNVVKRYEYDAFGNEFEPSADDSNPFRYCGEYYDVESGSIYLRARYYDPAISRMLSEDPARVGTNWYIYCNNNPVIFSDRTGLAPTPQQAAAMAEHIYDHDMSNDETARTVDGWWLITVWNGREGLKMGFYIPDGDDWQNPSEYSIVFKGTTMTDLGDWQNNVEQLISPKSADMWDALNYSKGFVSTHSQEITFVGHSKGGAEAASSAVATNKNAIIFNPATSNLGDYGLEPSGYTASMTAYIVNGDIVNHLEGWFSAPIDKAVYLPQQYGGHWHDGWKTSLWQRIQNHLMPAVKSALKEAGY